MAARAQMATNAHMRRPPPRACCKCHTQCHAPVRDNGLFPNPHRLAQQWGPAMRSPCWHTHTET
eukprot:11210814-Lingulodinium_polyedra.AAC.1